MHGAGGSRRMIGKMLMLRLPRVVVDLWLPILCLLIAAGAFDDEIAVMGSLTSNLHLMLVSFYCPTPIRYKILLEKGAFPSDQYVVASQAEFHGYSQDEALIEQAPRIGEEILRTEDILETLHQHGLEIALVLLPGVQYYTGQAFNMELITSVAQSYGCIVGWDLAHATGNLELELTKWNVDFAVFCSYKYLNSGPGGIAGLYVNNRHSSRPRRFAGWWGKDLKTRFDMKKDISLGLRDVRVTIPTAVQRGDNALLICNYDMENDTLYSIKWYKGKREFYRYTPKENPPMQSFPVMGIQVERNASNASQVTIEQVETNISGKFSCEVSAEPSFHTMIVSGGMEVVDIPDSKPEIEGLLSKYQPGDRITANCSSDYSKPAANLSWTINEIEASPLQLTLYKLTKNDSNLEATVLGINFAITHQHFLRGKLKLRCTSKIHEIHEKYIEKFVEEDRPRILATSNGQNLNLYQHVYDGEMNDQDEQYQKHYKADMSSSSAGIKVSYLTICWITFYIGSTCTLLYSLRIGVS